MEGRVASITLVYVYCTAYCIVGLSYGLIAYYVRPPRGCGGGDSSLFTKSLHIWQRMNILPSICIARAEGGTQNERGVGRETA
jgi:hypothetical protein